MSGTAQRREAIARCRQIGGTPPVVDGETQRPTARREPALQFGVDARRRGHILGRPTALTNSFTNIHLQPFTRSTRSLIGVVGSRT
ncbi:hypothetical protein MM2B0307_1352 [Mycobacteroides abscessus subsp. bolletii 2B-0307]|uniref:Uncharacterized protein n=1 Tax=Mycobacteroides abscessus MAB_091912_2446 TaxID=1335414 RepID=A0A829MGQ7_9MYCO|nr:hypothetical protein MM2B0307_1352 [Mycobacteroides abscessus subsp. bolletii 2B-0307]ESV63352.1 hypothetical protein L833_0728 [Mycobacteroides abscessus MAB_091912_2446]